MTMPEERFRSIAHARKLMRDLIDPKKTPRVPKEVRERARYILKHLPSVFDIRFARDNFDKVFKEPKDQ